ncbi:tautomerase family protein [Yinghuangia sp. YIM S10712]|uniref:tautomerase family protein n=1 Tax=Yinghuangia sp. YIM S10712 TaxID=3436930 RepID=UPI003F534108
MPHLTVYAAESQLSEREPELVSALTEAVVAVYGEWARPLVVVRLVGIPPHRWAVGGSFDHTAIPEVTFGIRAGALARPDGRDIAAQLVAAVTDAVGTVLGEELRDSVLVELIAQPDDRVGVGGTLIADQT